jgi:hypothetical protein
VRLETYPFGAMTLSTMILSIKGLFATISTTKILHYSECHILSIVMLTVIMLSNAMLNIVMLSAVMLSVVMLNIVMLSVDKLNIIMLSVMVPPL